MESRRLRARNPGVPVIGKESMVLLESLLKNRAQQRIRIGKYWEERLRRGVGDGSPAACGPFSIKLRYAAVECLDLYL